VLLEAPDPVLEHGQHERFLARRLLEAVALVVELLRKDHVGSERVGVAVRALGAAVRARLRDRPTGRSALLKGSHLREGLVGEARDFLVREGRVL
jgi:hypothetical protein